MFWLNLKLGMAELLYTTVCMDIITYTRPKLWFYLSLLVKGVPVLIHYTHNLLISFHPRPAIRSDWVIDAVAFKGPMLCVISHRTAHQPKVWRNTVSTSVIWQVQIECLELDIYTDLVYPTFKGNICRFKYGDNYGYLSFHGTFDLDWEHTVQYAFNDNGHKHPADHYWIHQFKEPF